MDRRSCTLVARPRAGRLLALCAVFGALAPGSAGAAPPPDRAAALALYRAVQADTRVEAGWTGDTATCTAGIESAASRAATLHAVNALRAFAGLGPVTFDEVRSAKALAAALMMKAANSLSHTPDPAWPCYSADGAAAAGNSNLYLGESGAAAMVGYVDDDRVPSLGHRRWLLDPRATVFGSGSTGGSNALWVVDGSGSAASGTTVAWPPAGWVPWPWVFTDWSLAVGNGDERVAFDAPQVDVTLDGAPLAVSGVRTLASGFGPGETLAWRVAVPAGSRSGDHRIEVTVRGVQVAGAELPVRYTVDAFPADTDAGRPAAGPRFTVLPRIARPRGRVRPGALLRVVVGTSGATRVTYRWLRDGRAIAGATGRSRRVARRDRGHVLSVLVTAWADTSRTSVVTPAVRVARR